MSWIKLADCESGHCLEYIQAEQLVVMRESADPGREIMTTVQNLSAVIVSAKAGKLDHLIVGS